jgi:glycosyltransferase involved in cell wall biosynthesis
VPELIEDGKTGHLTPVGDTLALASAIERVLLEPGSVRLLELRQSILARFGVDRLIQDMEGLYRSLLARKGIQP